MSVGVYCCTADGGVVVGASSWSWVWVHVSVLCEVALPCGVGSWGCGGMRDWLVPCESWLGVADACVLLVRGVCVRGCVVVGSRFVGGFVVLVPFRRVIVSRCVRGSGRRLGCCEIDGF